MRKEPWLRAKKAIARKRLHRLGFLLPVVALSAVLILATSAVGGFFDRWVPLQGAKNFRDIGGYDAGTSQVVTTGLVYRSDALHEITQEDADAVQALGIGLIVDLRVEYEITRDPDFAALDTFSTHTYVPISFAGDWSDMSDIYSKTVAARHDEWRQVFELIADPDNLPLDYHCQAGKDRAGLVTAQLLCLLGVDRAEIVEDYMLSENVWGAGSVDETWVGRVLDDIETSGGIDLYLDSIGVDAAERAAIRHNLLGPRSTAARRWPLY